jgi:hypothetical protein
VYDLDAFDTNSSTIGAIHDRRSQAICYINAGSWEDWRPDATKFPATVIGLEYEGWAGEKWLDIRQLTVLDPILQSRLDICRQKGFDAVEFDNMDGYQNDTGFPLSARDQLAFNIWLANQAHARNLAAGFKNDPEQAAELWKYFDFAIVESCFSQKWCDLMQPFLDAGKPVLAIEYTVDKTLQDGYCHQAQAMGISLIFKNLELDSFREICR